MDDAAAHNYLINLMTESECGDKDMMQVIQLANLMLSQIEATTIRNKTMLNTQTKGHNSRVV